MIARRNFFRKVLGGLIATAFTPAGAWAEGKGARHRKSTGDTPSPTPATSTVEPPEKTGAPAQIRLWKTSDTPGLPIQIRFLLHGKSDADALTPLKVEEGIYQFSNYADVPVGPLVAEVSAPNHQSVLLPLNFVHGGRSTLLVRLQGTSLTAEWIDDLPNPVDGNCEFSIYNLLLASGDIQVTMGSTLNVRFSSTHSSLRLKGLKRANYVVSTEGVDGNGKNFHWNTEADLRQCRKATLLVCPDAYGRIRPHLDAV